jgi:hypothetical protein
MPCHGSGRSHPGAAGEPLVRIEAIVPAAVAEQILDAIQGEFAPLGRITVCTEMVEVLRPERF